MKLRGKNVLVYGMGASGQEASKLLYMEGACVSIYDDDKRFCNMFCYEKEPLKKKYDLVVVSPGIKVMGNELINSFNSTPVLSELDLGYSFMKGRIIAITGTNGKTTTCSLLGKIFSEAGKETFVCGNIGLPICNIAPKTTKNSISIVEVSNFQLELSRNFKPDVACVLNITEDHIDRHGSFEEYKKIKNKIFQHKKTRAVINLDENESLSLNFPKKRRFFSKNVLEKGAYVKNGYIFCDRKKIMLKTEVPILGDKNLENVLACVMIARMFKLKPQVIRKAIATFVPPSHRLEFVGKVNGAKVYNDSKSTNVACTAMAIDCLKKEKIILLVGGRNKGNDFDKLFALNFNAKKIICFGECREELFALAKKYNFESAAFDTMAEATAFAREIAQENDVILFSPACASFDEFSSYSARGQRFKELIMGQE